MMGRDMNTNAADDSAESILITDLRGPERYESVVNGELAYLQYRLDPGRMVLIHTEVPPDLEGKGIGSALARRALNDAAQRDLEVVPECQFVASFIREHPQYLPLVAPEYQARILTS